MHACLILCPPNRLWKLAHFPSTMMSCVEWKERSVPGLFHPFVWPVRAKGVTVKEVIFKCIYSVASTHLLSPSHQTVTAACLPILSPSVSLINLQITAVTAAHCFAWVNTLKWILTGLAWEYISYYACQPHTTSPFLRSGKERRKKKTEKKMDSGSSVMPKKSRAIESSHRACRPDKSLSTILQALAMHALQLPWLGRVDSGRCRGAYMRNEVWILSWGSCWIEGG